MSDCVSVSSLKPGDTITKLGKVTFPFPFKLTRVQELKGFDAYTLVASHGWFAPRVNATDKATLA